MQVSLMFNGDQIDMWDVAAAVPACGDVVYVKEDRYSVTCRTWSAEDFVSLELSYIGQ